MKRYLVLITILCDDLYIWTSQSQSSALTDDESKDTRFGRNGSEKIIRAVHAQKKVHLHFPFAFCSFTLFASL